MTFHVIKERDTEFLLIGSLHDSEVRLESFTLIGLQVVEQVHLD
jgi:hypothetical protein